MTNEEKELGIEENDLNEDGYDDDEEEAVNGEAV